MFCGSAFHEEGRRATDPTYFLHRYPGQHAVHWARLEDRDKSAEQAKPVVLRLCDPPRQEFCPKLSCRLERRQAIRILKRLLAASPCCLSMSARLRRAGLQILRLPNDAHR